MANQHRATDEAWDKADWYDSCLLELRDRIQQLEAVQSPTTRLLFKTETTYKEASDHARRLVRNANTSPITVEGSFEMGGQSYSYKAYSEPAGIKAAELEWARTAPGMRSDDRMLALQDQIRDGALSLADALKEIGAPEATPSPRPSMLVDRVAKAINPLIPTARYADTFDSEAEARAAIREVAAWLLEQDPEPGPIGRWLGQISTPCGVMADLLMHEAGK